MRPGGWLGCSCHGSGRENDYLLRFEMYFGRKPNKAYGLDIESEDIGKNTENSKLWANEDDVNLEKIGG